MRLPETKEQWEKFKASFLKTYKVEDSPETWTFVLSQLQNTKMPELEFDPKVVHAHYKRWKIAKVLQDEKTVYLMELQAKVEEKLKAMGVGDEGVSPSEHTEHLQDGAFHSEGDVPSLPDLKEGMVPDPL